MAAAFKNHTRQIGKATLATGAAAQELGVHVAVVAVLFKVLSCLGVKRTSGGGGGGFFRGGLGVFDSIPFGSGITASLKLLQRHETSSKMI